MRNVGGQVVCWLSPCTPNTAAGLCVSRVDVGVCGTAAGRVSGRRVLDPEGVGFGFLSPTRAMWPPGQGVAQGETRSNTSQSSFHYPLDSLLFLFQWRAGIELWGRPQRWVGPLCWSVRRPWVGSRCPMVLRTLGGKCDTVITKGDNSPLGSPSFHILDEMSSHLQQV